jgi:putative transposase
VIAGFVRGLSTQDVEATLGEAIGESAAVSKSTVSRICEEIKTQFEEWSKTPPRRRRVDFLFLDGSHFKYHANASAEPVLAALGHRHRRQTGARRPVIGVLGGFWPGERGLCCPLLMIGDGAAGLIGAVER